MSVGCSIVASDTQPLHEAIKHDETGRLVNFFDHNALAASVIDYLMTKNPRAFRTSSQSVCIENYDLEITAYQANRVAT